MKSTEEIKERIRVIDLINDSDIDELKGKIPDRDFQIIKTSGDEWLLLRGYGTKASDALRYVLSKNTSEFESLRKLYHEYMLEIYNGSFNRAMNPYLVVERHHALAWVLGQHEWGSVP